MKGLKSADMVGGGSMARGGVTASDLIERRTKVGLSDVFDAPVELV